LVDTIRVRIPHRKAPPAAVKPRNAGPTPLNGTTAPEAEAPGGDTSAAEDFDDRIPF
jgi:hypothetical protein